MGQQRFYTSNAVQTTLAASLGSVAAPSTGQTVQITSNSGYPTQFPFTMLLEWGTVNQEVVTVTQAATGTGPFTYANCIRGDDGTAAPAHSNGAAVYHGVSQRDWSQIQPVYNVCDHAYGADPTGVADSTAAIQAAINAAHAVTGGIVYLPAGTYGITSALTMYPGISFIGAGAATADVSSANVTLIFQNTPTAGGITAVDLHHNTFRGFVLYGSAVTAGTARGIFSPLSVNTNQEHVNFEDVIVGGFAGNGIELQNLIVSRFECVESVANLGHGFYIRGVTFPGAAGTSVSFVSCYANSNSQIGFWLYNMVYSGFHGCAADGNGVGYQIDNCQGVTLNGCGAEGQLAQNGFDGTSFKVTASFAVALNGPWTFNQGVVMLWVTAGSQQITISSLYENTPNGTATASIKTDAGTMSSLNGYNVTTATSLAANTVNVLNDGTTGHASLAGSLSLAQSATAPVTGANGTIATAGLGVSRVAPSAARAGIILQVGTAAGQTVTVVNESAAANTLTFDVAGTSHVADGVSDIIAGLTARSFVWDSGTSLWYRTA